MKTAMLSHIVQSQITDNIEVFLSNLDIDKFRDIYGNITGIVGYGAFGCVFKLSNNNVMKITFDYKEAPFLYKYSIIEKVPSIVKVHKIDKIKFGNTYAYVIIRDSIKMIKNDRIVNDVINFLKMNKLSADTETHFKKIGGLEYKIYKVLESIYKIDNNWRGTSSENIGVQKGRIVLFDGFPKNIDLDDSMIELVDDILLEAMLNKNSLEQLKKVRKLTKNIDISDRIDTYNMPNQIGFSNAIDRKIQTYDEYLKEPFRVNQNVKDFKPKNG